MKGTTFGLPVICLGALILSAGAAQAQGRFDRRCEPLPLTILDDEACPVALETHKKKATRICLGESRYEVFVANRSGGTVTEFEIVYEFTSEGEDPVDDFRMVFNADPSAKPLRLQPTTGSARGLHYFFMRPAAPRTVRSGTVKVTRVEFQDGATWEPGSPVRPPATTPVAASVESESPEAGGTLAELESAAERGDAEAQYRLGVMFADGRGVLQDFVLAHAWLNMAAAQGHSEAGPRRDAVAERMTPQQVGAAQKLARKWQRRTAD